jgi:uncharacterized YigZ family protein
MLLPCCLLTYICMSMLFDDQYFTIEQQSTSQFLEKGSRFITYVIPVRSEAEIKAAQNKLLKEYHDATHHCYAWALMPGRQAYRMNDDGEPTGTAGKSIFGAIQSADLTNILIVVIRYFGGTKLGISGLINAYRKSAKEAIEKSVIVPKFITEYYKIDFEYINLNNVMHIVKENSVYIVSNEFGMKCDMQLAIRRNDSSKVLNKLSQIKNLTINYLYTS